MVFLGIFLISLAGLVLEIAITRIFSAAISYHFTFVAVSVALVGLGSSGLLVHQRLNKIKEGWASNLTITASLGITLMIPLTLFVMHLLASRITYLPLYMLMFASVFFFIGIVISAAFNAFAHVAGRLYAADLIGASLGAVVVVLLLSVLGGEGTALVVGLISSICAAVFSVVAKSKKKILASLVFIVFASSLLLINETVQVFSIQTDPAAQKDLPLFLKENPGSHIVKTQWNSFSRIDVVEGITGNCAGSMDPYSQRQCSQTDIVAKIFIDGGAGTNIISWDGNLDSRKDLSTWMQYLPFKMSLDPKVLIIGSGGGRDVVAALSSGSTDVTAVEINPIIFETVKSYGDKAGNLYTHQYVRSYVDEGRSFISRSQEKYDIIYIPFVDTWASVSSGSLGVSENFLYTVEGFQEYYDHLEDDGKIIAIRWLVDSPRFVSTFSEMLERNGVPRTDLQKHLVIVSSDSVKKDPSMTMVIFSKSPFTESEIQFLSDAFERSNYKPILIPGKMSLEPYSDFLNGKSSYDDFYAMFTTKTHFVTDDDPFFLSFEKPLPKVLQILVYISVAIVVVFLLGPYVWLKSKSAKSELKTGTIALYFAALGMGFILIELSLLQKLILLLGNPTMTFAILLFTILVASGIGSFASGRIIKQNTRNLTFVISGIIILGFSYTALLPSLIYSVISEQFIVKSLISVAILFPVGFLMGMPLPSAMRLIKSYSAARIPWMWAINGAFSVFGAVLSVAVGISFGSSFAMLLGTFIYFIALGISFTWKKKSLMPLPSAS